MAISCVGCASVSTFKGLPLDSEGVYVGGVPPVKQTGSYACGAACVAAVAAYWGVDLGDFRSIYPSLSEEATGKQLQEMAETVGLQAFYFQGSMTDLKDNLQKGRPLIVMIPKPVIPRGGWLTASLLRAWNTIGPRPAHWVIALGYTDDREIVIHDPASGPIALDPQTFESWWAAKNYRCVLIAQK